MRHALIIVNPGEEGSDNYCPGVFEDSKNFRQFFQSAFGGLWHRNEIEELVRPSALEVMARIETMSAYTYTIIVFVGHGHLSKTGRTVLELRDNEVVTIKDLSMYATKRLVLVDSCRARMSEQLRKSFIWPMFEQRGNELFRNYYDYAVARCKPGVAIGYACRTEEVAHDKDQGGLYSLNLLRAARTLCESSSETPAGYSIFQVHELAGSFVGQTTRGDQRPEIEFQGGGSEFPFAVFL